MISEFLLSKLGLRRFHFVGIGGIGMSALADILVQQGFQISGSDLQAGPLVESLRKKTARIAIGHDSQNLGDAQVVVYSSAISTENPELDEAKRRGLLVVHRSEILGELMRDRIGIAVSGTHGKTTTTSMLAQLLTDAGCDPTAVIGARLASLGGNARLGQSEFFVAEADESDRSFLRLPAVCSVVTNIDLDHMDVYHDLEDLQSAFLEFLGRVPYYGIAVACLDDPAVAAILPRLPRPALTYGLNPQADLTARELVQDARGAEFRCLYRGHELGRVRLNVAGRHNVLNALAAIAVAQWLALPFATIKASLAAFRGAERRLHFRGESEGIWVIDDYAHHPTEIRAALEACSRSGRRLVVVFQPHRYSRTQHLLGQMKDCFDLADRIYVLDVYGAGEPPRPGVDGQRVAEEIAARRQVAYVPDRSQVVPLLKKETRSGDTLLTLGAGDVWKIGEEFLG